ncbi:hypothetical protein ACJJTC_019574 [Scirpophaga incertulas]
MDNIIKNITQKLSVNDLVDMLKESNVIDNDAIKEEDVRHTFSSIDPNTPLDVEEMTAKLNEICDDISKSKNNAQESAKVTEKYDDDDDRDLRLQVGKNFEKLAILTEKLNNFKSEDTPVKEVKSNHKLIEISNEPEKISKTESDFLSALGKERNDFALNDDFYYF